MKHAALFALIAALASGCASPDAAPVCDGRHRRPLNGHGSVLRLDAPPQPGPGELSQASPQTFGSC